MNGFWIVFSTQLGNTDILVRTVTDVLWLGNKRVREWRGGKIQTVYYTILIVYTFLALLAIRIGNPLDLFKIAATVAGFVLVIGGVQISSSTASSCLASFGPPGGGKRACWAAHCSTPCFSAG